MYLHNDKESFKTCYTNSKKISNYKKTMEETFIKYFRAYIKNKRVQKNNDY